MLAGKSIVLCVTGGIAAYKAVELCRLFVKAGAEVRVIMTSAAKEFISPLTFVTVSGNPVYSELYAAVERYDVAHVGLAAEADLFVIAPATANCIGKIASGIADDLLTTAVMAAASTVLLAPAMNVRMYENPITQSNIKKLTVLGYQIVEPEEGELACGDIGRGRMADPETIFRVSASLLARDKCWQGRRIIVTAGPTREALDPVRYISNHSSGKMGYAIARAAAIGGAEVVLVSGPTNLAPPVGVRMAQVVSAQEMREAVMSYFPQSDVVIKAAAVADYRPSTASGQKIKKGGDMTLTLVRNPDILAELGELKEGRYLVGFAAETEDMCANAHDKLRRKNLDMIVANDLTEPGAGFDVDTNVVRFIFNDGTERQLPKMSKTEVAEEILKEIYARYRYKKTRKSD
ncbi:MAG: bifunctional phosphopantothenoylcysteine decarboxylase/phosphopantothenate--cysteine ligase CoaBC [Dethiobacter sp.]|jgi:phosphopantothenoylcysteine decarboxylase/phosphopantothenate--cysteine ligase|nr:bifunctional phosphopantothenoylcysteine decarboxylase/phosphopantothenate--cysteine ligase CoaBC [Dethiobacter sp.]